MSAFAQNSLPVLAIHMRIVRFNDVCVAYCDENHRLSPLFANPL